MLARLFATGALVAALLVVAAPMALAHVELAGSTPPDGQEVTGPLQSIELTFTEGAKPAGDGIQLMAAPDIPVPATVTQVTDTVIVVTPAEPLAPGSYAIGWSVQAGDAHPRTGAITFSVTSDPTPATAIGQEAPVTTVAAVEGAPSVGDPAKEPVAVEAFASLTEEPNTALADWMGRLARWLGLGGALIGIGALIFGAAVPLRSEPEARQTAFWVRRAGLAVLLSVPFELIAQSTLLNGGSLVGGFRIESFSSALAGPFGWALLLRAAGGAGLLWGTALDTTGVRGGPPHPSRAPEASSGTATVVAVRPSHVLDVSLSALAVLGSLSLMLSYLFDGHTVTASPALLVKVADLVHVGSGAVWVGGVSMLALTLTRRHAAGGSLEAAPLIIRFSTIATVALAAAGAAGLLLTWSVLDGFGELFTTGWGRVLLGKLVFVGGAAAIGAYNHFVILPQLTAYEGDERFSDLARRTTRAEAMALIGVIGLTAILVGSAS